MRIGDVVMVSRNSAASDEGCVSCNVRVYVSGPSLSRAFDADLGTARLCTACLSGRLGLLVICGREFDVAG